MIRALLALLGLGDPDGGIGAINTGDPDVPEGSGRKQQWWDWI